MHSPSKQTLLINRDHPGDVEVEFSRIEWLSSRKVRIDLSEQQYRRYNGQLTFDASLVDCGLKR